MKPLYRFSLIVPIIGLIFIAHKTCLAANVLFMHTGSTYSHRVAEWPLVEGLLKKGHNVTFISPFGPSGKMAHQKVTEIIPPALHSLVSSLLTDNFDVNYRAYGILPPLFAVMDIFSYQVCDAALSSSEIQEWLAKKPKIDLVIGDMITECSSAMALYFGAKHALFSPIPLITEHYEYLGISSESASIPDYDVTRPVPLTFLSRVIGTILPFYYMLMDVALYPWYAALFSRTLGLDQLPDVMEMRGKVDLLLINGNYISDYARSWPPLVAKVEGIHIKRNSDRKPLAKDVEAFINSRTENGSISDGFLFMSFGTVAKAPSLPLALKKIFFDTIESFPNIKFIWKWDGKKPEVYPKNLLMVPWVDQQDILAHPKIRGFLTQAGRPSTQEALYHEVPMITFPILGDQDFNAQRSADLGLSVLLDFVGLTEENLKNAISEILTNKKYKERVSQLAKLARDVLVDPVDVGVWWVEFVMRHTQEELDLMKPLGRHLSWYQKRNLDCWLFLLVLFLAGSYLTFFICKRLLNRFVFSNNNESSSQSTNASANNNAHSKKTN